MAVRYGSKEDAAKKAEQEVENDLLLATAADSLNGSEDVGDSELKDLVKGLLKRKSEEAEKARQRRIRLSEESVASAKLEQREREHLQKICSHLKQDGRTRRTGGQYHSDGRLRLGCTFCQKEWWLPPKPGEEKIPHHLIPSGDEIGGAITAVPVLRVE